MTAFTVEQIDQLLRPIHPARVLADAKGHSHVSQQDVLAHLIRVFGFGAFDIEVMETACVFEAEHVDKKTGEVMPGRYDVCYRALVRLTIRDTSGSVVCHYENGSTATAQNQTRGDAHDLAYKSAISLSVKRAAIALGDQFGLSLYNKGQRTALVMRTLAHPKEDARPGMDSQDGVEQQVALGNDEAEESPTDDPAADLAREQLREFCVERGEDLNAIAQEFIGRYGVPIPTASVEQIGDFADLLQKRPVPQAVPA